jgi:hypothetical protein
VLQNFATVIINAQDQAPGEKTAEEAGVPPELKARIDVLISQLKGGEAQTSENASLELVNIGKPAMQQLQEALKGGNDGVTKLVKRVMERIVRTTGLEDIEITIKPMQQRYAVGDDLRFKVLVTNKTMMDVTLYLNCLMNVSLLHEDSKRCLPVVCRAFPQGSTRILVFQMGGMKSTRPGGFPKFGIPEEPPEKDLLGDSEYPRIFESAIFDTPGKYTISVTYGFDRDAFVKACKNNCPCHDAPERFWNGAIVGEKAVRAEIEVDE